MGEVQGIGGLFLRARNPEALYRWYEQHFELERKDGAFVFPAGSAPGSTVLAFFPLETDYFGTGAQGAMLNLRVRDLDKLLERLRAAGAEIDPRREEHSYGRFAWITDAEGNRVELWEPAKAPSQENAKRS